MLQQQRLRWRGSCSAIPSVRPRCLSSSPSASSSASTTCLAPLQHGAAGPQSRALIGGRTMDGSSRLRHSARPLPLHPCAAAPEGFDSPASSTGSSSDGRGAANGSYGNTDAVFTSFQSISFAEPAVQQAGPSTSNDAGYQGRTAGSGHQQHGLVPGGLAGPSRPARPMQHDPMQQQQQHSAQHASPPSLLSYSEYYRQQNLAGQATGGTHAPAPAPSSTAPASSASHMPTDTPVDGTPLASTDSEEDSPISVEEALSRAQQALDKVESSLDAIDQLPSARPEPRFAHAFSTVRALVTVGALCAGLLASHAFGLVIQWLSAALCGAGIAVWGYRKGSLSASGALAAAAVGMGTLGCSLRLGVTLLAFYFSSSKLTQYKEELKSTLDDQAKKGGQRDWVQVFCNALVPTILAIVYGVLAGCVDVPLGPLPSLEAWRAKAVTALMGGFLGYYACCCGDTWASELGPLSADTPRLITTMRPVRKGTNGGVTLLGLSASILGGAFIGATFYAAAVVSPTLFIFEQQHMAAIEQWKLIPLGLVAGLVGSVLDSVLGATLQYSGYNAATGRVTSRPGPEVQHISGLPWLSNNAVNAVSASTTAIITALAALKAFGF